MGHQVAQSPLQTSKKKSQEQMLLQEGYFNKKKMTGAIQTAGKPYTLPGVGNADLDSGLRGLFPCFAV